MQNSFSDLIRSLKPISQDKRKKLSAIQEYSAPEISKKAEYLLKTNKIKVYFTRSGVSTRLIEDQVFPELQTNIRNDEVNEFVKSANAEIQYRAKKRLYRDFSAVALNKLYSVIAPNIFGLESIKKAVQLQLFATEPIHILLLGDPGTGKTEILRSVSHMHPITSFGLGSGTSGAGLGVTVNGKEISKGLLPRAHEGICCIDELNLMKKPDYAFLYSAMEKGFISYDKANQHVVMDAKIRILASANPKGDKFVGKSLEILKKQIPFQQALLSRFHLVFLIRKPGKEGFLHITKKIIDNKEVEVSKKDFGFIQEYVLEAEKIKVEFPKSFKESVVSYIDKLHEKEKRFLIEFSPRIVVGLIRMCKAKARLELRSTVSDVDVEYCKDLLRDCLTVKE